MLREGLQVRVELFHLLLVGERHPALEALLLELELPLQEGDLGLGLAAQPPVDLLGALNPYIGNSTMEGK